MTETGSKSIEIAKQNGSWTLLDTIEALIIPEDLNEALTNHSNAAKYFQGLSKSQQKILLHWVISAKKKDTRQKRIVEIVQCAAQGKKPKQFL